MTVDVKRVQAAYFKMRAKKSELTKAYEAAVAEIDEGMSTLETYMLGHLNGSGADSTRTQLGTCYVETVVKPSCTDWPAFYGWMAEQEAFGGLEKRVSRAFISTYMQEHQEALPPGIKIHKERVVRFRAGND